MRKFFISIIVPCKNEFGTVDDCIHRLPTFGVPYEVVFVDGHSTDGTWQRVQQLAKKYPFVFSIQQTGVGKWNAVMEGFARATGTLLMILDADLSVEPELLARFYTEARRNPDALIIGSRFILPQERGAMRLLNHTGNIFFSWFFSQMLRIPVTDTLCGTKVVWRKSYNNIVAATHGFRSHDPYGDFTLLLGAALCRMQVIELPVSYRARVYGSSKISRFRDGMKLLVVLWHAGLSYWKR